ncbi:hypothetical protein [Burkholderia contaminans]|uniref:hypothetical protein n=1 Tax=Burkholderia contaminans TaxID=488447 RepID=UPI000F5A8E70|nr:hypothetical protein [Burkholderia contaminans]
MRLKESIVTIEIPEGEDVSIKTMRLSGLLSEWLFSSKFWAQVNARCGTIFDQYEEDSADEGVLNIICEELTKKINGLSGVEGEIEFVHGWDVNRNPLVARINSIDLVRELSELRVFFEGALKFHVGAYLSL